MGRRRGRGEGYIEQLPSGSWRAVVSLGVNRATGKRTRLTTTRHSKPAARAWLHDRLSELGRGELTAGGGYTVAGWMVNWLDQKDGHVSRPTHRGYRIQSSKRIVPYLGTLSLAKLKRSTIADWYAAMLKAGIPASTCRRAGDLLIQALTDAVRQGVIPNNPAALVKRPRVEGRTPTVWNAEQVARFRESIRGHQMKSLFVLALDTGMRQGELLALEWSEVDLVARVVRVTHSLERGGRRKECKTRQSRRVVSLSLEGVNALFREGWMDLSGRVFPYRASWVIEAFQKACKRAGVPLIRFHDLRHTHATLALAAGASIRAVSARLGHSNPAFTLRVYAHAMPEQDEKIAEIWGGLLASRAGALTG